MRKNLLFNLSILILILYLVIRILDYSQVVYYHPLSNQKHDIYSYIPQLFFLGECGFYKECGYWYNGFVTFISTPPGWYLTFYPVYLITNSVLLTLYLSVIIIFVIGFLLINHFGKLIFESKIKRLFFFAFLFGNNIAINSLRLGRIHELMAFISLVIGSFIIFNFKDNKINKKFYYVIPFYTMALLTYHSVGILFSTFFLGLLLIKGGKEFFKVLITVIISFILAAFWWLPLLLNLGKTSIVDNWYGVEGWWMFKNYLHFTPIAVILIPIALFSLFYLYLKIKEFDKKEFLFFIPSIFIIFLFFIGVMPFIPVMKHIFTNLYLLFSVFLILCLFLNLNRNILDKRIGNLIYYIMISASVLTIVISIINTPFFDKPTKDQNDIKDLLNYVDDKFLVVGSLSHINSHRAAFYSYAPIFRNLSTPDGHYPVLASSEYVDGLNKIQDLFRKSECDEFKSLVNNYNTKFLLTSGEDNCKTLQSCDLKNIKNNGQACLYTIN
ncbi:MAG: hypothetical protein AABY07_07500 [Nanoarchaeota archaeon]